MQLGIFIRLLQTSILLYNHYMTEQDHEISAFEKLRRLAWPVFREFRHIKESLSSLRGSEEFTDRIRSFNAALLEVNEIISSGEIPKEYIHLKRFSELWGKDKIPTLSEALSEKEDFKIASKMAFEHARENYPGWANESYNNTFTPAVGIFLMGYGYYLGLRKAGSENQEEVKQIGINFDHGLEEVLIIHFPNSPILDDVGGWIREERDSFSPEIIAKLAGINSW